MMTNDEKKAIQCVYNTVGTISQFNEKVGKNLSEPAIQRHFEHIRGVMP